jgi:hypothetical protein
MIDGWHARRGADATRWRIGYSLIPLRAIGAAGARFLHTEEVTGSIPVSPTFLLDVV